MSKLSVSTGLDRSSNQDEKSSEPITAIPTLDRSRTYQEAETPSGLYTPSLIAEEQTITDDRVEEAGVVVEQYVYPDGGYGWVVVGCCTMLAAVTMGWGMNYGVFQEYYGTYKYPDANPAILSLTGTTNTFCQGLSAFCAGRLGDRYGFKLVLSVAAVISWVGVFTAGFATQLWQTILLQGVITGVGQGIALPLFMALPSQWFLRQRGLASGLTMGGAGLGGGFSTLIVRQFLQVSGPKITLVTMSSINLVIFGLSILLIKTRPESPEARGRGKGPFVNLALLRRSEFWSVGLSLIVAVTAYGVPFIYVGQWTAENIPNLSAIQKAAPLTAICFAVIIGRAAVGWSADRFGAINTYIMVFLLSGATQYALWLTAKTYAGVLAFSVVYGMISSGYLGIIPQMATSLFGPANLASNVGLLLLFNAPGNLIGGPVAGAIRNASGGSYKEMILVLGALQFGGGFIACWAKFKVEKKWNAKV